MLKPKKSNTAFSFSKQWPLVLVVITGGLLLFLSAFNYPSSDDYSFYALTRERGIFNSLVTLYQSWSGRMVSFLLMFLINPLADADYLLYKALALPVLLAFFHSVYVALKHVFWPAQSNQLYVLLLLFIALYLPNTADWFYWFITSYSYTLGFILLMYWMVLVQLTRSHRCISGKAYVAILLLPVLITGCCELSLLCFVVAAMVFQFQKNTPEKWKKLVIISTALGFLFALVWLFAPGSQVRSDTFIKLYQAETQSVAFTLNQTLFSMAKWLTEWCIKSPFVFLLILIGFLKKENSQISTYATQFQVALGLFLIALLYAAYFWATGITFTPLRLANYSFMAFCLLVLPGVVKLAKPMFSVFQHHKKSVYIASVLLFLAFTGIRSNLKNMVVDVSKAFKHQKEMNNRFETLKKQPNCQVRLPLIQYPLKTTYFADIDNDSSHWYNRGLASYYGVKSVLPEN